MTSRHETRAEKQAFLEQLSRVHDGDRLRILKEHQQYLNGQRPTDADFSSARKQTSQQGRQPRAWVPPTGKDASYMRANMHSALMTRRAVAAKTVAGSGKKRLGPRKKLVDEPSDDDEDYEDDEEGDDDECEDEGYGSAGFYAELQKGSEAESGNDATRGQAKTSKASRKKSTVATKEASKATAAAKKPRKKSARTLAKEVREAAVAAAKAAKVKAAQDKATEQQRAGKEAKSAARKRLEGKNKRRKTATAMGSNSPKRWGSPHRATNDSEECSSSDSRRAERAVTPATSGTNSDLATPASLLLRTTTHGETSRPQPTARIADPLPRSAPSTAHDGPPLPQPAESSDSGLNLGALDSDCEDEDEELVFVDEEDVPVDPQVPAEIPDIAETMDSAAEEEEVVAVGDPQKFPSDQSYPGLYYGPSGPSPEVIRFADSPLDLFLYFMPRELWKKIAEESTVYHEQNLVARVDKMYAKQKVPGKKTKEDFMEREAKHADIKAHEIVVLLGLLIARMTNPQRRHFYDHWSTTSIGAVAAGTFGKFMRRNRFTYILSNLHFTNNGDARAGTDRAWKVRSVVDTLQTSFGNGYTTPPVLSFDEAMIPLPNRHNPTRQFVANKPHRWGTKKFMTCCAKSSYCLRLEIYCGAEQHIDEIGNIPPSVQSVDLNTGPAAVMRNLEAVLPPQKDGVFYLDAMDRFYTSVQLAYQLLKRQVYCVGTIQDDRQGFCQDIAVKSGKRPKKIDHGTTRMAVAKNCPLMTSLVWWDRRPVLLLGTGGSRAMESCYRWKSGGVRSEIPCPSMMRDYHRWMGVVDVHDQLRLQRYSLQQQTKCKKYDKAIFLGLVDVAIVNAYIVYREAQKSRNGKSLTHAEFLTQLQAQMLDLTEEDFAERQPQVGGSGEILSALPADHVPRENPDYQEINGQRKRRQRQCKVCSNRKRSIGERRATKYYCPGCSPSEKTRTYLCNKVWPHWKNNTLTCHQIWHHQWKNGAERPRPRCGRDIQNREAGAGLGKRKRRRRAGGEAADEEDTAEGEDDAEGEGSAEGEDNNEEENKE
ncbi:hypothetical protein PPTG_22826 [Phytophthora nicotianae INRA-310]|uniref:PiggyBac transposable element-derived protein domain-containing protein n=1 Tax=Phytophthora nicotianae (strain INRA-310) TaxID=761204 RepID=W2Q9A8_PHYN3|nr:hypothetical protein PPTG_22826 [Phytophthora nicotianae INRA-310]ETN09747.1 hypothetical protein PPTG_22826 [Phytophthora nicotianae INRA-310]